MGMTHVSSHPTNRQTQHPNTTYLDAVRLNPYADLVDISLSSRNLGVHPGQL
jgi:hypothetical protein